MTQLPPTPRPGRSTPPPSGPGPSTPPPRRAGGFIPFPIIGPGCCGCGFVATALLVAAGLGVGALLPGADTAASSSTVQPAAVSSSQPGR